MTVIRHKHKRNFTQIPNSILRDERISIEAKGALAYMLSRPPQWEFYHWQLQQKLGIGKQRLQRIIGELTEAGYLRRSTVQPRDGSNRFAGYGYVVHDVASAEIMVVPHDDVPRRVIRRRNHDNHNNKEGLNTELTNPHPNPLPQSSERLLEGEQYTDFGLAALANGQIFVYEGSKPYRAWSDFRGEDGLPLSDIVKKDGVARRGIWMPSLYPLRRRAEPGDE
jgi:hypothetical protein